MDKLTPEYIVSINNFYRQQFYRLFRRPIRKTDEFMLPVLDEVYKFEFNMWCKGKYNYNVNSRRNKPKTMAYITKRIIQLMEAES